MNVGQRLLTREGDAISLPPKATDILLLLLQNAGELVEKDDLMREVWPDSFVEEGNLTQNIFTLRRALGDHRSAAQYIDTVVRRGYRFVAAVKVIEPTPSSTGTEEDQGVETKVGPPPILAVLPFINATEDNQLEYLADGVSENIINSLSQISKLRVMSRSTVFRYKGAEIDPKVLAGELNVDAMLLGKLVSRPTGLMVNAELVDATNGWVLWGDSFDFESKNILEIQEEITQRISSALRLKLSRDEQKRITARYTENASAYEAYIEGRFHWIQFTRAAVEKAIVHFRKAIELDPTYALAYSGIVDCYLRLATGYLPPVGGSEFEGRSITSEIEDSVGSSESSYSVNSQVKLRHEWDWKVVERELRRANELHTDYPAAHQWRSAYLFAQQLSNAVGKYQSNNDNPSISAHERQPLRIPFGQLTASEEVQVFCAIARDQIDVGNYEAATLMLRRWWQLGSWPRLTGLDSRSCADLLFTTGELAGFEASTKQQPIGQKNAENLLSGSIALFEQLGSSFRAAEGRLELALCYYRQGNFDLARSMFVSVLETITGENCDLRCLALVRLASLERHAGRLQDALHRLTEANDVVTSGPWVTARHHLELASTYKELAISEENQELFEQSLFHYSESRNQFQAIGNLRMVGIAENNLGYLLVLRGSPEEAYSHLSRARKMFEGLNDLVRRAQVDDTLARLHLAEMKFGLAENAANRAIETLQSGDEDVLLAEVLSTKGIVCSKLGRHIEAERIFEWASGVALRCGDREGAGRVLLLMFEELGPVLSPATRQDVGVRFQQLLLETQQSSIRLRVQRSLEMIRTLNQKSN
jgi:DNA-binding winged-HTH domains